MSNSSQSPAPSQAAVLAANRTHRPDPLHSFQMYTDGWNISSIHYLASAGYTGMPGFIMSLLWFILGFFLLLAAGCMLVWCPHVLTPIPNFGNYGNYTTLGLLIVFTTFTVCGCGSLFAGEEALHTDLSTMLTYIMTQVAAAAESTVESLPPAAAPQADQTADAVEKATNSTSTSIHAGLDEIRVWLLVLTATMLLLALIGLVFVLFHTRTIVYTLVTIGWLLVMGTWILWGIAFLVEAVVGDSCVAMDEWVKNPTAGTGFDVVMKCKENSNLSAYEEDHLTKFEQYNFHNNIATHIQAKSSTSDTSYDSCSQMRSLFVPILRTVVQENCPPMRKNSRSVRLAIGLLSWGSMTSICLWLMYTRRATLGLAQVQPSTLEQPSKSHLPIQLQGSNKYIDDTGSSSVYHSAGPATPTKINEINIKINGGRIIDS